MNTILVVDDVAEVLKLVSATLSPMYNVLQATSGVDALAMAANHVGIIDLLLSDVKMPGMSGPELGDAIHATRPETRVMFMSGFPGGFLLVLNYGWAFIEKPFIPTKLVEMVKNVLEKPVDESQTNHQSDLLQKIRRKQAMANNGDTGGESADETDSDPSIKK